MFINEKVMVDKLYELVTGEEGFIIELRCDNHFNEKKYSDIKNILCILVLDWKSQQTISKKAMMAIIELLDCLVGGSRFFDEDQAIRVEDASIEIKDIINDLYETI